MFWFRRWSGEPLLFLCGVLVVTDVSSAVQSFSFFGVVDGRRQRRDKNFSRTRSLRDPSATRRRILRLMHSDVGEKLRTDGQQDTQSISPGVDHPNRSSSLTVGGFTTFTTQKTGAISINSQIISVLGSHTLLLLIVRIGSDSSRSNVPQTKLTNSQGYSVHSPIWQTNR